MHLIITLLINLNWFIHYKANIENCMCFHFSTYLIYLDISITKQEMHMQKLMSTKDNI